MKLNLFFLAPLLQCTSIDRCALFMRAKINYYFNKFLSPFSFKKYFLFLSFSLFLSPASFLSSFFLLIFFPSPSSTLCFTDCSGFIFIAQSFIADLHRPFLHRHPISGFRDGGLVGFHGGYGWLFLVGRGGGPVYGVFIVVRYCSEMKYFIVVDILFYCDILC